MATSKKHIEYPYLATAGSIHYVPADNKYMQAAKAYARKYSLDTTMPNSSIIVLNGIIVGQGANGSTYHEQHGCERVRRGIPTGQGYELCEGCSPKNHGEPRAIADAHQNNITNLQGAQLYLWGHWWCCKPCWDSMLAVGITDVYLLEHSEKLFNKESPENIIGKQFATL